MLIFCVNANSSNVSSQIETKKPNAPKIHGYLQTGYNYGSENGDNRSSFRVNRFRLFIDKEINKVFDFRIQMELFSGSVDATSYKKKVATVMDAYFSAKLSKGVNFRVGQFYTPMGFENYDISPATLEVTYFSDICYRMACRNPLNANFVDYGRDQGIMLYGDLFTNEDKGFNYLSYNLAITNGYLPTLLDDNLSKDIYARFTFRPIKDLRVTASYSWGESKHITDEYVPMSRFILGAWYQAPSGLGLRAEYGSMKGTLGNNNIVDEKGFYALASYKMGKFLPVIKYEMFKDNNLPKSPLNKDSALLGVTYHFNDSVKLQANYAQYFYHKDVYSSGAKEGSGNGINLVFLVKF